MTRRLIERQLIGAGAVVFYVSFGTLLICEFLTNDENPVVRIVYGIATFGVVLSLLMLFMVAGVWIWRGGSWAVRALFKFSETAK